MSRWTVTESDERYAHDTHKPGRVERAVDKAVETISGRCTWSCGDVDCPAMCPVLRRTSVGATLATLSPAQLTALDSTGILGYLPERTAVRTREALIRRGLLTPVARRGGTRYRLTDAGYDARSAIPVRVDTAAAVSGALAAGVAAGVAVGMLP